MTTSSPYRGLAPFEDSELDALFFFGREHDSEIVVANLIASRFTVLYGPSGVGKSSLLLASVARKLRELPEEPLVVVFSSWTEDPESALAAAFGDGDRPLLDVVGRVQADRDVYLILDQAEEYFVYHGEDTAFEQAVAELVTRPLRVNVLLSLREDTLARLDRLKALIPNLFGNVLRLDRLDRASGRAAIMRPLERWSELNAEAVTAEAALVENVLDGVGAGRIELGQPGGQAPVERNGDSRIEAPYLQLVMQRLWEVERAAGSTTLHAATLAGLGGAGQVVADHLERAIDALTPPQQALAAVLFDHLVTPSGTKIAHEASDLAQFTGRPEAEVKPVLAALVEHRILRTDEGGRYEIFHDVLAGAVLSWTGRFHAEQTLARERQRRRRAVAVAAVALAAVGLMAAVTVYALSQRSTAQDRARVAQARELQAVSGIAVTDDPELALLLATEAARLAPTASSEYALRQALMASRARAILRAPGGVKATAAPDDGSAIVTAGGDRKARIYGPAGRVVRRTVDHGAPITGLGFAPASSRFATAGADGNVRIWTKAGKLVHALEHGTGPVRVVSFSSGGETLLSAGADGEARIWNVSSGAPIVSLSHEGPVLAADLTAGGDLAATTTGDRFVRVWDARTGTLLHLLDQRGFVADVAFSPDGRLLATAGANRTARIWSVRSGRLLHELEGHEGRVVDVAFSRGGHTLATASTDGTARIWNPATGAFVVPLIGHRNAVRTVAFSPDGNWVETGSDDGTARTWTTKGGNPKGILAGHRGDVDHAFFLGTAATVLTVGDDGTARLWDSGAEPELLPAPRSVAAQVGRPARRVTTPDGEITARIVGRTVVLQTPSGRRVLRGHRDRVNALALSPDGRLLASAGRDFRVRLWSLPSGRPLTVLKGHFGSVADVRFSPDGRWLVTAGPVTAGLWPVRGGRYTALLHGPESVLTAAAFSRDGREILTTEKDGSPRRWRCDICVSAPELLTLAERRLAALGRTFSAEERERYLG